MDFALLLFAMLLRQAVAGLKLQRLDVPAYTFRGKNALLECRYELGTDKLYSITWYKDHEEFYRYVPRGEPTKHSYTVEGIKVDKRSSDHQQVRLLNASLHTRGRYKCEVSAEAPNFNSVSAEANMEVVVLPQDGPTITGVEEIYATGDVLDLNCTSGKSHPAANLTWFINGEQVSPDSETMYEQHGLFAVISSLRLRLQSAHISAKINVRCEATVELDTRSDTPFAETRTTEVFVEGHASIATSCMCLTVASALLLRLLPPV